MEFEEVLEHLKEGKEVFNKAWNGIQKGKILYIRTVTPLEQTEEVNYASEPYIEMVSGTHKNGGWAFKRFPWTPSALDMFSEDWVLRE